jgi:hypothetical protein
MSGEADFVTISDSLAGKSGVSKGSLFGKPCIKLATKAFAAFHKSEMVFKLTPTDHSSAMALKGAHLWDPSGANRPMKEWVCIPHAHVMTWLGFAEKALAAAKKAAK